MHDVIIIGAGPAGLSAAIYCRRAGLGVLVIESNFPGGQMAQADMVENYPGIDEPINGYILSERMHRQAINFGAEFINDKVLDIQIDTDIKTIITSGGRFESRALVLAMGRTPKKLGLPDEARFVGAGVSYCATCDGAFFKGRDVAVVGGGDGACQDVLYLSRLCGQVYLIHRRDTLRAAKMYHERVLNNEKIRVLWDSAVEKIIGSDSVEGVRIRNVKTGNTEVIGINGLFVAIGSVPGTDMLKGKIALSGDGYVIADELMRTNVPGIFAVGDVREKELRQIVTAASDGAVAAYSAEQYLLGL